MIGDVKEHLADRGFTAEPIYLTDLGKVGTSRRAF